MYANIHAYMMAYMHICTHDLGFVLHDLGSFRTSCPGILLGVFIWQWMGTRHIAERLLMRLCTYPSTVRSWFYHACGSDHAPAPRTDKGKNTYWGHGKNLKEKSLTKSALFPRWPYCRKHCPFSIKCVFGIIFVLNASHNWVFFVV